MRPIVGRWYKVTLPFKESGAGGKVMLLQDAFDAAFMANQLPENAAMFGRRDEDPNNYSCYFSPGAVQIAEVLIATCAGVMCEPPVKAGLTLRIGYVKATDTLL
jgi:hypothetical protein